MAEINNEQRKALARIVEENGTYDDYYRVKYAAKDEAFAKKHSALMAEHKKLDASYNALCTANNEAARALDKKLQQERIALEAKHDQERNKLCEKQTQAQAASKATVETVAKKLRALGFTSERVVVEAASRLNNYETKYADGEWNMPASRFRNEYDLWRKSIVALVWAASSAVDAQKLVARFLKGVGKDEPTVQEAAV